MDKTLTIISHHQRLDYSNKEAVLLKISGPLSDLLWLSAEILPRKEAAVTKRALYLLDCVIRLQGHPKELSVTKQSLYEFGKLQRLFYGALYSNTFVRLSVQSRHHIAVALHKLLLSIPAIGLSVIDIDWPEHEFPPHEWIYSFDSMLKNESAIRSLSGYWLHDKNEGSQRIYLEAISQKLGITFARQLHEALMDIALTKAKDSGLRDFANTLNAFIAQDDNLRSKEQLKDVSFMHGWMIDFMTFHFTKFSKSKEGPKEGTLGSLQKLWGRYVNYIGALGKNGLWAVPLSMPAGNPTLSYHKTIRHQRTPLPLTSTGPYTQKLLTPIPLEVTDKQAAEILFHRIEADLASVKAFFASYIEALWTDYQTGHVLEKDSELASSTPMAKPTIFQPSKTPRALANTIAAIRCLHKGYVDTTRTKVCFYPHGKSSAFCAKTDVARHMGFLNKNDCLSFAALLMALEPQLTESALLTAKAFDHHGRQIGVKTADAGTIISVRKDRVYRSRLFGHGYSHIRPDLWVATFGDRRSSANCGRRI